jgi:hydrogenase 3 maturation protease
VSLTAVLGVGNRLRGDDAVGPLVIDRLRAGRPEVPAWKSEAEGDGVPVLFDCGTAPENFIEPVLKAGARRVLFIDACAFGADAGEFRLFDRAEIDQLAMGLVSTHTLPLTLTVELIAQRSGADVRLLGIQPARIEFGQELSAPVSRGLSRVVEFVRAWLKQG